MALITDPVDFKIDRATGEIIITDDLQFTSGLEAVAQNLDLALGLFTGEWFLNLEAGVDYYGEILGQKFNEVRVRDAFRRVMVQVQGVEEIISLSAQYDGKTRTVTVAWEVRTEFDDTITGSLTQEI